MPKLDARNLDQVDVFQGGPHGDWLIDDADVPANIRNSGSWARLRVLTIRDLFYINSFRKNPPPPQPGEQPKPPIVSDASKALTVADLHALGRCFTASRINDMSYPDMVIACCCCS
jgi:hypothetical protein